MKTNAAAPVLSPATLIDGVATFPAVPEPCTPAARVIAFAWAHSLVDDVSNGAGLAYRAAHGRDASDELAAMVDAYNGRIAAIGGDGLRLVVWGLGSTCAAALADAAEQEGAPGRDSLRCVQIGTAHATRVESGDIDAAGLASASTVFDAA